MASPTTDRRLGLVGNTAIKAPVTVLASSNITQSGQQTIDGVAVLASNSAGVADRVLCVAQTDTTKNGIWDVSTAAWTRSKDADGNYDLTQGTTVLVTQGASGSGAFWQLTTSGRIVVGTTALTWTQGITFLSALQFFNAGSGSDDTSRLQAAINAAPSGSVLLLGPGVFTITSLTINKALTIRGSGKGSTILRSTSATLDGIVITTTSPVELSDFQIDATVTRTAGAYVKVIPGSGSNFDSVFRRVSFIAPWIGINFVDASDFTVDDCYFVSYRTAGIQVANTATPDSGDSLVFGSTFDGTGGVVNSASISQISSGGLRVQSNKFLGGSYHYLGQMAGQTSILIFNGNSTENAGITNVAFTATNPITFSKVVVSGNQFSVGASATALSVTDPGYAFLDDASIGGNTFNLAAGALGINLGRGSRVSIFPNSFISNGAATVGVTFSANCTATVWPQNMPSVTTRYNGTMTNVTFVPGGLVQTGTSTSAATATGYGGSFIGPVTTVTFPTAYPKTPGALSLKCTEVGGGVGVLLVDGSLSATQFQYKAVGSAVGSTPKIQWEALGG